MRADTTSAVPRRRWDATVARVAELADLAARDGDPQPDWLGAAATWAAEVAPTWEDLTGVTPANRCYRRIVARPALEAWLICWPEDAHLQLHDHGGACGALHVVRGTLHERSLQSDGSLADRSLPAGGSVAFDGSYIHDVRNLAGAAATTLHLYGPAVRPMAFYDDSGTALRSVGRRIGPVGQPAPR